eukprot:CAMPEP_0170067264 /NCGR_PEP_ID=MMETSP0019_2-20121128/6682_1 /TAXON_ID=98059 /ORGANISM="Dinobryon sp., Strain UTEXLB2267" /LENGTH=196 /DNA_ID=CAMNT_0010274621 /DNA_START=451 /DNA_END=1041 /DNA_ORIENTATION=-
MSDLNDLAGTSPDDPVYALTQSKVKLDEVMKQSNSKSVSSPLVVPLIPLGTIDNPLSSKSTEESGYLSLKVVRRFTGDTWQRRFFLLRGSLLFHYKDKSSYISNPGKPINRRPLELSSYSLQTSTSHSPPFELILQPSEGTSDSLIEDTQSDLHSDSGNTDSGDAGLAHRSKVWHLRCDTQAEFAHWLNVLNCNHA